jgi:hypothetical protein
MKRLTPVEVAANRKWTWKAWLLTVLPSDQIAAALESPMPPTITELLERAKREAVKHAGKCPHCGKPLPVELAAKPKKRKKPKVFTP